MIGAPLHLPPHSLKSYQPAGRCIYCGATGKLSSEHIIPRSAGGRWVLPAASCGACAKITSAFEGELTRTVLGPLRMLYNMPTRRPKERPRFLSLKVKYPDSTDWELAEIDRSICPFLVGLPIYPLPDALSGQRTEGVRTEATRGIWIRGAGFLRNRDEHLQWLCDALGAVEVMPEAHVNMAPVCLSVAKIAHAFAVAELGSDSFEPFLSKIIVERDLSNRAEFIGGGQGNEPPANDLHVLEFDNAIGVDPQIIAVRVRLLGILGTPTYHVAVGKRLS